MQGAISANKYSKANLLYAKTPVVRVIDIDIPLAYVCICKSLFMNEIFIILLARHYVL